MNNKIIFVNNKKVTCEGDKASKLGHPKVYLHTSSIDNRVTCSYCGITYLYKTKASC